MPNFARKFCVLAHTQQDRRRKAVGRWLLAGVVMLVIQSVLGGITRLTGSGLSITKWDPLFGILPPLNAKQWNTAFEGYKQIGQFKYLNAGYSLADFKAIFFWEWLHRFWARTALGMVFAIGFIYFLIKKYFDKEMILPMVLLFVLGGLQGAVGWIMVQSGLNPDDVYVNHIKLMLHFVFAMVLTCYTLWFALSLLVRGEQRITARPFRSFTVVVLVVLFVQLAFGAFMAGLKAATTAPTWPRINSEWVPGDLHTYGNQSFSGLQQFISNPLGVQLMHRTLAYLLTGLVIAWFFIAAKYTSDRSQSLLARARKWPLFLILLQVLLGILTVMNATPGIAGHFAGFELLAEAHQLVAMLLLIAFICNLYAIRGKATDLSQSLRQ